LLTILFGGIKYSMVICLIVFGRIIALAQLAWISQTPVGQIDEFGRHQAFLVPIDPVCRLTNAIRGWRAWQALFARNASP
jgi:hypothetical protein